MTEILAAWVSVPDLSLHASRQRYEHVRPGVVRFTDLGVHEGFSAELELDADGLVLRLSGARPPAVRTAVTRASSRARRSPS